MDAGQHLSFKYFLKVAFIREISLKLLGGFGAAGMDEFSSPPCVRVGFSHE